MGWAYDPLEDGATANATNINAQFTTGQTWIDDIENSGLRLGTFNRHHAGSLLRGPGAEQRSNQENGNQTYSYGTFGNSMTYSAYGTNGGTQAGDF